MKRLFQLLVLLLAINTYASDAFLDKYFTSKFYENQFVGFSLSDPKTERDLYDYNGSKNMLPASITKILTLYVGLKNIDDKVPSLEYIEDDAYLHIRGTGDPTLLHSVLKERSTIDFLNNTNKQIILYMDNNYNSPYPDGWVWDDYSTDFSAERSAFPMFGNVVKIESGASCSPEYFSNNISTGHAKNTRLFHQNQFNIVSGQRTTIPFITSNILTKKLLEQETGKTILLKEKFPAGSSQTLRGIATDEVYKRMLEKSDNFFAEQVLAMSSYEKFKEINSNKIIKHTLDTDFARAPQKPRWVDGSGLSRYDMISPATFTFVLNKIYDEFGQKAVDLFAIGGINGTLKNSYKGTTPYVFAKTGSMSGVFNLAGYVKTRSGKLLTFAYINNNFSNSGTEQKKQIEKALTYIRDNY